MSLDERLKIIPKQERAYTTGSIEFIENDWIFFDELHDKAFSLEELGQEVEIQLQNIWCLGTISKDGIYLRNFDFHYFKDGDLIRFQKKLFAPYQEWLDELSEVSFRGFVEALNSLSYSIFDCIFYNNFLSYVKLQDSSSGMNLIVFDNENLICSLQHHFYREKGSNKYHDRFEFTLSDGTRKVCGLL